MACPTILPRAKHTATLIFLHGLGDTGHGWLAGFEEIALPYVKYICPNAPSQAVSLNAGMVMPSWFDITSLKFEGAKEDEEGVVRSSNTLKKIIEEEEKAGISSERIIIGGFSQGGSVSLHSLLTYNKKLAGVIGLSTFMTLHEKFDSLRTDANKNTPVFLGHGDADPVVNYEYGLMTKQLLGTFYTNVKFTPYNKMGHSSCSKEMKDVSEFIKKYLPSV